MLRSLIRAMRPHQWVKNFVVFAGLVFAQELSNLASVGWAIGAFGIFCLVSSGVYIINDIRDLERDRRHPTKSKRPLAAGEIQVKTALGFALLLLAVGLGASVAVSLSDRSGDALGLQRWFAPVVACYIVNSLLYSFFLKNVVIVDVMVLALGFVLRAAAGGMAIDRTPSEWLLICSFLLALFLAFGKRRHELILLDDAHEHRQILKEYSPYFLDQMMGVVTATTVVAYAAYTMNPGTIAMFGTKNLVWTIPLVMYGIFRYLYLVHQKEDGGSPTKVLLTDRPILATVVLWAAAVIAILYLRGS